MLTQGRRAVLMSASRLSLRWHLLLYLAACTGVGKARVTGL